MPGGGRPSPRRIGLLQPQVPSKAQGGSFGSCLGAHRFRGGAHDTRGWGSVASTPRQPRLPCLRARRQAPGRHTDLLVRGLWCSRLQPLTTPFRANGTPETNPQASPIGFASAPRVDAFPEHLSQSAHERRMADPAGAALAAARATGSRQRFDDPAARVFWRLVDFRLSSPR